MLLKMRSKMQNEKGFTLVELMVVVVILGILVAIAVPVYNNVSDAAKTKADQANVRILNGALSQWAATEDVDLTTFTTGEPTELTAYVQEELKSPYGDAEKGTSDNFTGYDYNEPASGAAAFYSSPNQDKWKS